MLRGMKLFLFQATGWAAVAMALMGCTLPQLPIATPEPLSVNINVKMDVYQHAAEGAGTSTPKVADAATDAEVVTAEIRQAAEKGMRNRMEQIQTLKNNRLVGESRDGLLEVREVPPGEYGEYTVKTVEEENADREKVMRALALEEKKALTALKREQGAYRRQQSFKGEWVEEEETDGTWRWIQKAADPR